MPLALRRSTVAGNASFNQRAIPATDLRKRRGFGLRGPSRLRVLRINPTRKLPSDLDHFRLSQTSQWTRVQTSCRHWPDEMQSMLYCKPSWIDVKARHCRSRAIGQYEQFANANSRRLR